MYIHTNLCLLSLIVLLPTEGKWWILFKYYLAGEWIERLEFGHMMECYSVTGRNYWSMLKACMNLKNIKLSRRQVRKITYGIMPLTWHAQNKGFPSVCCDIVFVIILGMSGWKRTSGPPYNTWLSGCKDGNKTYHKLAKWKPCNLNRLLNMVIGTQNGLLSYTAWRQSNEWIWEVWRPMILENKR